jgi:hypothetical protein
MEFPQHKRMIGRVSREPMSANCDAPDAESLEDLEYARDRIFE